MNKMGRIKAALRSEEVDRVPANLWHHLSVIDQDARDLAEQLVENNKKYDFDFIKLMPFGLYAVQDWGVRVKIFCQAGKPPIVDDYAIHVAEDWRKLEVLPPIFGSWGKTLRLAQYVGKLTDGEVPFVQTIFSPLTLAQKLAGDRILIDMKESPELLKQALEVITETLVGFVKANIEAGVSGFFFATRCSNYGYISEKEYEEFGVPYDLRVIDAYRDTTYFNILHLHGQNSMFDLLEKYPVHCLNWHDRSTPPSLREARTKTGKCLLGGLQELPLTGENGVKHPSLMNAGTVEDIEKLVHDAIRQTGGRGLIVGPGCGSDQFVPEQNIFAIRKAVGSYKG